MVRMRLLAPPTTSVESSSASVDASCRFLLLVAALLGFLLLSVASGAADGAVECIETGGGCGERVEEERMASMEKASALADTCCLLLGMGGRG